MTAPDTTGGELREQLARELHGKYGGFSAWGRVGEPVRDCWRTDADELLSALPALRDLLAERDTLAAQVQAVEGLAEEYDAIWQEKASDPVDVMIGATFHACASDLRRALGTPTTGGGE